jgi:transposase
MVQRTFTGDPTMNIALLTIELAKNVFQLHGADSHGKPVLRKQVKRAKLAETVQNLPPCRIVMEACGGSHYWARRFQAMGHEVQLIAPQFVKPFRKSHKNDRNDAEAIAEAASRPTMRYVSVNTTEQQDIQMLHRVRSRLVKERTAISNQIRGLLAEYGIVMIQSVNTVRKQLPVILEDTTNELSSLGREVFADLYARLTEVDERIAHYDRHILRHEQASPTCRRLEQVRGVGPMTASAFVATVGNAKVFRNGREFAAWLGLVPKQVSSGGKDKLLGITRRGDKYLRTLLIQGAQAVLRHCEHKDDSLSRWANRIRKEKGTNVAAVALANKTARMMWAMLAHDQEYRAAA